MNLSQLYYYRTLTQTGSYKDAAAELFISQPALSLSISNLEKELGVTLIARRRNKIELTEEGEEFALCVAQCLKILDEHVESIKRKSTESNSILRLGIVYSAQGLIWSSIMREFWLQAREKPQFRIHQDDTPGLLESLKRGDVDIVIAGSMGPDDQLVQLPCWSQDVVAAVDKDCPLAVQKVDKGLRLDDLRGYNIITYKLDGPVGNIMKNLVKGHDLDVHYKYADEITMCSMVSTEPNLVALTCSTWLVRSFERARAIKILDAPKGYRKFYLSYRASLPRIPSTTRSFIDYVLNFDYDSVVNI